MPIKLFVVCCITLYFRFYELRVLCHRCLQVDCQFAKSGHQALLYQQCLASPLPLLCISAPMPLLCMAITRYHCTKKTSTLGGGGLCKNEATGAADTLL